MKQRSLDLRRVPIMFIRFAWLTHLVEDFDEVIISKEQSYAIFSGNSSKPWSAYKGIPLKIK